MNLRLFLQFGGSRHSAEGYVATRSQERLWWVPTLFLHFKSSAHLCPFFFFINIFSNHWFLFLKYDGLTPEALTFSSMPLKMDHFWKKKDGSLLTVLASI